MAKSVAAYPWYALNRGIVDPRFLSRVDHKKVALAAETQTNWMPSRLGSMSLRAGLGYIGATASNNKAKFISFVFATDDLAKIEVSDSIIRVWVDDALITRPSVSTAFTNGTFDSDIASWTDASDAGATLAWATGGYMSFVGTDFDSAIARQTLTVSGGDQNVKHALRIIVTRGPIRLRAGSTLGGDEYVTETVLGEGEHSLAFTPTGASVYIQMSAVRQYAALVDSIAIEASGTMTLPGPWTESDLWDSTGNCLLESWQSNDVTYIAVPGFQQRKLERRAAESWSIVLYQPEDGPYRVENVSTVTLTPSALAGDITLTASKPLFRSTLVGALFTGTSVGQKVTIDVTAEAQWSDPIKIVGVGTGRKFNIDITGTFTATITLQRSILAIGAWTDVTEYTTTTATTHTDGLDNQIVFYRIGSDTGDFTSGTATSTLTANQGSIRGVARVTGFTSTTVVDAIVYKAMGGTSASVIWSESEWSDFRGWPGAVAIFEGRLSFAGKSKIIMSVSDGYEDFDPDTEGASGPLNRTIGSGPIDTISWLLPAQRLLLGVQSSVSEVRSSSLDEVISPTNFNIKEPVTLATAPVSPIKVDTRAIFVHGDNKSLFELKFDQVFAFYTPDELTKLVPDILSPACIDLAVQRRPDTRIHCVRNDGKVVVFLYDPNEDLNCAVLVETDGVIEDVVVMPGQPEERVYYVVNRTIGGSTVRYLEKFALEREKDFPQIIYSGVSTTSITGLKYSDGTVVTVRDSDGTKIENLTVSSGAITLSTAATYADITPSLCRIADSFATFTNSPAAASVPAGTCSHLVAESVVVWADGKCLTDANGDIETFTVAADGGIAALTNGGSSYSAETGVVGLTYTAPFKSGKLFQVARTTGLTMIKAIRHLGLILHNTHAKGLKYGTDFDHLDDLPGVEQAAVVDADSIWSSYDFPGFPINDASDADMRLCLQARAPRPATVVAAVLGIETEEIA